MRFDRGRPLGVIHEASIEALRAIQVAKARRVVAHRDANERGSGVRFAPARIGLDGTREGAKRSVLVLAPRSTPTRRSAGRRSPADACAASPALRPRDLIRSVAEDGVDRVGGHDALEVALQRSFVGMLHASDVGVLDPFELLAELLDEDVAQGLGAALLTTLFAALLAALFAESVDAVHDDLLGGGSVRDDRGDEDLDVDGTLARCVTKIADDAIAVLQAARHRLQARKVRGEEAHVLEDGLRRAPVAQRPEGQGGCRVQGARRDLLIGDLA
jgi:hypothetical protein